GSIQMVNPSGDMGRITKYWNSYSNQAPVYYELEWLYVDDYNEATDPATSMRATSAIPYDFRHNSTRVQTTDTFYTINNVFDHGYVLCRVRRVQPDSVSFSALAYSDWQPNAPNGTADNFYSACTACLFAVGQHQEAFNWQYESDYAEEGKRK